MILGYCRVSTEEQATDGRTSMAEQERVIRGLAMMRGVAGADVAMFSDPGVSGATPLAERPAGAELLEAAHKGDVVVACKLDRLFRSAGDAITTAEKLKARGVDLILTDMGNNPVTENGTSKMFFGMLACVAEFERTRIAERITLGKRSKMANGGFAGGHAPYGYRVIGRGRRAIVEPDRHEQHVIAMVHEMGKDGLTHTQIVKELTKKRLRGRGRQYFHQTQVKRMLAKPSTAMELVDG